MLRSFRRTLWSQEKGGGDSDLRTQLARQHLPVPHTSLSLVPPAAARAGRRGPARTYLPFTYRPSVPW